MNCLPADNSNEISNLITPGKSCWSNLPRIRALRANIIYMPSNCCIGNQNLAAWGSCRFIKVLHLHCIYVGMSPTLARRGEDSLFLCSQRNFWRHIVIAWSFRLSICPASCPVHISNILLGRNTKFGVWMHLGMMECGVPFFGSLWPWPLT